VRDGYGHVKISRKAYAEDPFWLEPRVYSKWEAWEDCIQMASWKARKYMIGHTVEELRRGEFQASVRFLATRWSWGKHAVEKFLAATEQAGRLRGQRRGHGGTVYLLVNYERYQGDDARSGTPEGTDSGTPRGHLGDKTEAVKQVSKKHPGVLADLVAKACDRWKAEMGGTLPFGRVCKAWKPLLDDYPPADILDRWDRYFAANQRVEDRRYLSPENFAQRIALHAPPTEMELTDDFGRMVLHRRDAAGNWVPAA
jgi:hypothetical protein